MIKCSDDVRTVDTVDLAVLHKVLKRPRGNPSTRRSVKYFDIVCAFDIETTRIKLGSDDEQSVMYVWQFQLGTYCTVIGRTWQEYRELLRMILERCDERDATLCIYVHNLSYEFQFLRGWYPFAEDEVFAMEVRRILKCTMYNRRIEYRCSMLHSNMSLAQYAKKMRAPHQKQSGEDFNYSKIRYPWTPLLPSEMPYIIDDVRSLVESLMIEMRHDEDDLYTIPLTSTGYVRRDAKEAMRHVSHDLVAQMRPDYHLYRVLREAFRGGNTHGNRYYTGIIIDNVHSADRSSSYPDVQLNCEFPMGAFYPAGVQTTEQILHLINDRHKAVVSRVSITGLRLRCSWWGCPYLSYAKCRAVRDAALDNGRVLSAAYLETTLTDVDLRIVLDEYDFDDIYFFDVFYARYGRLPEPLLDVTRGYYRLKTELKGVKGSEVLYTKSKNKLNSIYGMMAQDPVKETIKFYADDYHDDDRSPEEILAADGRKAFLSYAWGVWVCAWARLRLEEGIKLAGENFLYCDTDSVKYIGNIDWTALNAARQRASALSGAYADDPAGARHYMGVYEPEDDMPRFVQWGAKKYAYDDEAGNVHITIAGVNKVKGAKELQDAGGLEALREGFVFRAGGGTESVYNDLHEPREVDIEGHHVVITSNLVIRDSTYTLGLTSEYKRLIEDARHLIGAFDRRLPELDY